MLSSSSNDLQSISAQGAGGSPDPPCSYGEQWARGETRKRCIPEQTCIGAELGFPRRVSLSQMQQPEASFVPFLRWALGGSLPNWRKLGWWGQCTQGLFRPDPQSPKRELVWSWFAAPATTSKPPEPREQEAAQTLLVPMASRDLGEKSESAAFLSKHALGLSLVSRGELHFRECRSQKLVLCLFWDGP